MPDQMNERLGQPNPEILKPESYGIYGRLIIATQPGVDIAAVLNPNNTAVDTSVDPNVVRKYNPITERLSYRERKDAWDGVDLNEAKREWLTRFTARINGLTDTDEIWAIQGILGKRIADFTEHDASDLYERFCQRGSDTSEFTKHVVEKFRSGPDGKIEGGRLNLAMKHIEWLAGRLFGNNTAKVVGRMIELEAGINNEPDVTTAYNKIFGTTEADHDRIRNLEPEEKPILQPLFDSFQESTPAAATPPAGPAAGATPPEDQGPTIDEDDWNAVLRSTPPVPRPTPAPSHEPSVAPPAATEDEEDREPAISPWFPGSPEPATVEPDTVSAGTSQPEQTAQAPRALTPELITYLDKIEGAMPFAVTNNLRRILLENGATQQEIDSDIQSLIDKFKDRLREQKAQAIRPAPPVAPPAADVTPAPPTSTGGTPPATLSAVPPVQPEPEQTPPLFTHMDDPDPTPEPGEPTVTDREDTSEQTST